MSADHGKEQGVTQESRGVMLQTRMAALGRGNRTKGETSSLLDPYLELPALLHAQSACLLFLFPCSGGLREGKGLAQDCTASKQQNSPKLSLLGHCLSACDIKALKTLAEDQSGTPSPAQSTLHHPTASSPSHRSSQHGVCVPSWTGDGACIGLAAPTFMSTKRLLAVPLASWRSFNILVLTLSSSDMTLLGHGVL